MKPTVLEVQNAPRILSMVMLENECLVHVTGDLFQTVTEDGSETEILRTQDLADLFVQENQDA